MMKINDDARNNETSKNDKSLPHNNKGCVVACWLKSGDDDREPYIYIYIIYIYIYMYTFYLLLIVVLRCLRWYI